MPPTPIRVLCADDHPLILDGVARLLEREPDMVLVAEANNGNEAVRAFQQHQPDVTLMDLQMPELNGVEAIHKIREISPRARCVVLTTYRGDVQASRAFKAGAVGYLLKTMLRKELVSTIREVHAGHNISESEFYGLVDVLTDVMKARGVALGDRNRLLALLAPMKRDVVRVPNAAP